MYRIAICDDEHISLTLIGALTAKILDQAKTEHEIRIFSHMDELLHTMLQEKHPFDVLLLDIMMTGMSGMEGAKILRDCGKSIPIIFISSSTDYAIDGYRVDALRYLTKPVQFDDLKEALGAALLKTKNKFTFRDGNRFYHVDYADIIYLESAGRDVVIHMKQGKATSRMTFHDLENQLPKNCFQRCHRSYMLNLNNIMKIERYQATMLDNSIVPISQSNYSETKEAYLSVMY